MSTSLKVDDDLAIDVDRLVAAGRFASQSDVLRQGLRLVHMREQAMARFDAEIGKGIDSAHRGESVPIEEAFDEVRDYIRSLERRQAA